MRPSAARLYRTEQSPLAAVSAARLALEEPRFPCPRDGAYRAGEHLDVAERSGRRFAERLLTVVATCRQQERRR
jgi:hypothetical protein